MPTSRCAAAHGALSFPVTATPQHGACLGHAPAPLALVSLIVQNPTEKMISGQDQQNHFETEKLPKSPVRPQRLFKMRTPPRGGDSHQCYSHPEHQLRGLGSGEHPREPQISLRPQACIQANIIQAKKLFVYANHSCSSGIIPWQSSHSLQACADLPLAGL